MGQIPGLAEDIILANKLHPIGSVWLGGKYEAPVIDLDTSTVIHAAGEPINPSTIFGGAWELFDKEFACANGSLDNVNDVIRYNSTQSDGIFFVRAGHTLRIRMKLITGVAIDDNGAELIKIADIKKLGITAFAYNFYDVVASSDSGNALLTVNFNADGLLSVGDVIKKSSTNEHILDEGKTIYFDISIPIRSQDMIDSFCDKFYWRRIG